MIKEKKDVNELFRMNQRYVKVVAKHYTNQGLTFEQLIEAGNRGLFKAAKKYNESSNYSFISYAVWWIRQSILNVLTANNYTSKELSEREREILRSVIRGETFNRICAQWGLTEKRLRQIMARTLRKAQNNYPRIIVKQEENV